MIWHHRENDKCPEAELEDVEYCDLTKNLVSWILKKYRTEREEIKIAIMNKLDES